MKNQVVIEQTWLEKDFPAQQGDIHQTKDGALVRLDNKGFVVCNCSVFAKSKRGSCKHTRALSSPVPEKFTVGLVGGVTRDYPVFLIVTRGIGHMACSCNGFTYRGKCRHIDSLQG